MQIKNRDLQIKQKINANKTYYNTIKTIIQTS